MSEGKDYNQRDKRRRAIRTALALGGVVVAIYLGFIMSGVLNAS